MQDIITIVENLPFWPTVLVALVLGLLLGWLMARAQRNESANTEAEKALTDYKQQVQSHFEETAKRVGQLAEGYQSVYEHLAAGANQLCEKPHAVPTNNVLEAAAAPAQLEKLAEQPPATEPATAETAEPAPQTATAAKASVDEMRVEKAA